MAITINAKGTSLSNFSVGKNGTTISQSGTITAPPDNNLTLTPGSGQRVVFSDSGIQFPAADGTTGQALVTNGSGVLSWIAVPGTGTVTSVSVASANGFAGSVANSDTTPALTISTSVDGLLKGNGTAVSSAIQGFDYSSGTSALGTGILKSTTATGVLTIAVAGDFPTLNQDTTGNAATATSSITQTEKNSTTSIATTAFVDRLRSMSTPVTSGTGALVIGDRGSLVTATGAITIPASVFTGLDVVEIFNNTEATIDITQGAGLTLRLPGTATTGNRTLAQYGMCTILFVSATVAVISGIGVA